MTGSLHIEEIRSDDVKQVEAKPVDEVAPTEEAPAADAPAPQETEEKEEDGWSVKLSRNFLMHFLETWQRDDVAPRLEKARSVDSAPGDMGDLFVDVCSMVLEAYHMEQGRHGVQEVIFLIWATREDEEVHQKAKAIEDMLGVPQGAIFLLDWVEEPPERVEVPEWDVVRARDVVWDMVKQAESREFQRDLAFRKVVWTDAPEEAKHWCAQPMMKKYFVPVARKHGIYYADDSLALKQTETVIGILCVGLRKFTFDAEVNGMSWRLEKAAELAIGTVLQVTPETTGGSKYPFFPNAYAYVQKVHWWEKFNVDAAYEEDGEGMVVPPEAPLPGPAPVLLLLFGHGHFNSRQPFMTGEICDIQQEEQIRKHFYVIAPKPCCRTGLAYFTGVRFSREWAVDAVWYWFTEILRKLGPEKVDTSRLYLTGVSAGSSGVWQMCLQYGRYFAAAHPCGGACEWLNNTWPRGKEPDPEAMKELKKVPFRAMHVDCDNHAPPPKKDIEYLTKGLEERKCLIQAFGWNMVKKFPIEIRKWFWPDEGEAFMEYWEVEGPLDDGKNLGAWKDDRHLVWTRSWVNSYWGMVRFFLDHVCPEDRRWKFEPVDKPDTSDHKANLDNWGYFDIPDKDLTKLRDEDAVEELVKAFRREAWKSVRYLREGQEVSVSYSFDRAATIQKLEFRAIKERPWDKLAQAWLKPHINTILQFKWVAAERWFEDIHKFDTFGLGFRHPPTKGAPPIECLDLDTKLTEEHVNLDCCEEKVSKQSPDAEEFTVWVLLKHHVDEEPDCYHFTTHTVKKGSMDVAAMKKVVAPMLVEKGFADSEDTSVFDLSKAAKSAEGPQNKIPGRFPLANNTMLTAEHQLLEVCKPGVKIELIIDPMTGMKKDYPMESGSTVWALRFMLGDGNETKAKRMAVGLPPKKKTDQPVALEDDVVLTKAHAKLHLWTVIPPKAKAAPK